MSAAASSSSTPSRPPRDDDDEHASQAQPPASPLQERDFANAATLLRLGTFRRNARRLYTIVQPQVLEWPSLTVSWLPARRRVDNLRDFSIQSVCVGTQAARGQMNYLACVEMALPLAIEDVDVLVREQQGELDDPDLMRQIPYRRVRGYTRLTQFVGVGDHAVLRARECLPQLGRETVAVRTAAPGGAVQLFHLSHTERFAFSTDPVRNAPDLILRAEPGAAARPGFGLGVSRCDHGRIAAGGDDGVLSVWDIDSSLVEADQEELKEQLRQSQQSRLANASPPSMLVVGRDRVSMTSTSENTAWGGAPVTTLTPTRILPGHTAPITDVACHGTQPHLLLSASLDGGAALWDLRVPSGYVAGRAEHSLGGASGGGVTVDIELTTSGSNIMSGLDVTRHAGGCFSVEFHPTASFQVATGGADGAVRLWDLRQWKEPPVASLVYHNGPVLKVGWAPFSDTVLASSGADGLVCLWDFGRGVETANDEGEAGVPKELAFAHAGHASAVADFAWSDALADEWTLASVDHSNMLQVWRPNATAVGSSLQADAFDEDVLDE